MPFGQVPVLDVDGQILAQSNTISRYLARKHGLAGKDEWEQAQADMYADNINDLMTGNWKFDGAIIQLVYTAVPLLFRYETSILGEGCREAERALPEIHGRQCCTSCCHCWKAVGKEWQWTSSWNWGMWFMFFLLMWNQFLIQEFVYMFNIVDLGGFGLLRLLLLSRREIWRGFLERCSAIESVDRSCRSSAQH